MDVNGDGENAGGGEAGGNQRIDRFGNAIVKTRGKNAAKTVVPDSPSKRKEKEKEEKKLRHKICFIDKFEKDADLIRVHYVLSYKKYNALNTYDPYDAEESSNHSHCCTTF